MSLDLFHLPEAGRATVRFFFANTNTNSTVEGWKAYEFPRNHSMVYMLAIGGGGGGGGGFSRAAAADGGGGGGGGGAGLGRLLAPKVLLPSVVYITVGTGGAGGPAGTIGTNGNSTGIASKPTAFLTGDLILLGAGRGVGGNPGTATSLGAGGAGGSGNSAIHAPFQGVGLIVQTGGQAGASGGSHLGGAGSDITYGNSGVPTGGGAGGGGSTGTNFKGGDQIMTTNSWANFLQQVLGGAAAAATNPGGDGFSILKPFLQGGGAGGNTFDAGTAGAGGDAGIGCGGGGGGAGTTGGAGGRGGDGCVVIVSW